MHHKLFNLCLFILLLFVFSSCNNEEKPATDENAKTEEQTPPANVSDNETTLVIYDNSFLGISPGDDISAYKSMTEKDVLQTGEGDFDVYNIIDENHGVVGYFYPEPQDESKVGLITIISPKAKTESGIHVGSTYGELKEKYDNPEVHGSEIEGRTHAETENLLFRLDYNEWSYEIDESKIPAGTKVIEITIDRTI